jgi:uncharacterized protein (TIGR03067 family)
MSQILVALAVTLAAPGPKDAKKDQPGLVGEWALESATFDGRPIPDRKKSIAFTKDGKFGTAATGPAGPVAAGGTYTHDPKKDPAELNITEPAAGGGPGRTSPAIYRIEGDTLTICAGVETDRLTTFDAPADSARVLMVLKRVAKKD